MILRRIARPMLASVFIASGIDALRNPAPKADLARGFVEGSVRALPDEIGDKVPTDPEVLVRINGALQVGSGLLLATGTFPRVAAGALAASLVPTTVAGHAFWNESDPVGRKLQRVQFLKNVSLLGGLLITAADTEGKPSWAWLGRRKANEVSTAVAAALPNGAKTGPSTWDTLRERAHEGAEVLGEQASEAAALWREHAPELAEAARERSAELADKATDVAERIRERAPEIAETARERSADLAESARAFAASAGDAATHKAEDSRRRLRRARA